MNTKIDTHEYESEAYQILRAAETLYWDEFLPHEALKLCKKANELQPNDAKILTILANMSRFVELHHDARQAIQQALKIEPDNLVIRYTQYRILHESTRITHIPGLDLVPKLQLIEDEEQHYGISDSEKLSKEVLCVKILVLESIGAYDEMLTVSETYLKITQDLNDMRDLSFRFEIQLRRASVLSGLDRRDQAIDLLCTILLQNITPVQRVLTLWQRSRIYHLIDRPNDAISDLRLALSLCTHDEHAVTCYMNIVHLYRSEDRIDDALYAIKQCIKRYPDCVHIARLYEMQAKMWYVMQDPNDSIVQSLTIARKLYTSDEYAFTYRRVECLRFMMQQVLVQREQLPCILEIVKEFCLVIFSPQCACLNASHVMVSLHHMARVYNLYTFIDELIENEKSNLSLYHIGIWYIQILQTDKALMYLREALPRKLDKFRDICVLLYYLHVLIENDKMQQSWDVLQQIPDKIIESNDTLRLMKAQVAMNFEEYQIALESLNNAPIIYSALVQGDALSVKFNACRQDLFKRIRARVPVYKGRRTNIGYVTTPPYTVADWIKKASHINAIIDNNGETILMKAVTVNNVSQVEKLLDLGSLIDHFDISGSTALTIACLKKRARIISLLVSRGASLFIRATTFDSVFGFGAHSILYTASSIGMQYKCVGIAIQEGLHMRDELRKKHENQICDVFERVYKVTMGLDISKLINDYCGPLASHISYQETVST